MANIILSKTEVTQYPFSDFIISEVWKGCLKVCLLLLIVYEVFKSLKLLARNVYKAAVRS